MSYQQYHKHYNSNFYPEGPKNSLLMCVIFIIYLRIHFHFVVSVVTDFTLYFICNRCITALSHMLADAEDVKGLRFICKQPSPHWKSFGIDEIKCYSRADLVISIFDYYFSFL